MKLFVKEKSFYRNFFPLLLVIASQALIALAVNLADNIMLGAYSELALSGAALVNQIQFMLQQMIAGVGAGVVVLGSQYWGKGEAEPIRHIIAIAVKIGLAAGTVFFVITLLFPSQALGLLTNEEGVIAEGVKYLELMCFTYIVFSVSNVLMYSLQSVQTAFIGTVMSVSTIILNICLNYCFIFGNFGCPELGIRGAAVATLTSRMVELLIILVYILCADKKLQMKFRELFTFDRKYFADYMKVAMPVVITGGLWGVAQFAQTAILGHLSASAIAANSIATLVFQIFAVFGSACCNASSVTIGKTIGEGRVHMVRPYARTLQGIFLIIGLVSAVLLFTFRYAIVGIYAVSQETRNLAVQFMTVLSIAIVGSCYQYPVEAGIIAGGGNTKYASIIDTGFMWLFTIPVSALAAFVWEVPPTVIFALLKADQILKCIPNAIYCNRFTWIKELTRK